MNNTFYKPFQNENGWTYGEHFQRSTYKWDTGHLLGPCPNCGSPCYEYGGSWRCPGLNCYGDGGTFPSWWNTGIQVKQDGSMWIAHYPDFINLQESEEFAFAETPGEAVATLLQKFPKKADQ